MGSTMKILFLCLLSVVHSQIVADVEIKKGKHIIRITGLVDAQQEIIEIGDKLVEEPGIIWVYLGTEPDGADYVNFHNFFHTVPIAKWKLEYTIQHERVQLWKSTGTKKTLKPGQRPRKAIPGAPAASISVGHTKGRTRAGGISVPTMPVRPRSSVVFEITPAIEHLVDTYFQKYWDFISQNDKTCYIRKVIKIMEKMQREKRLEGLLVRTSREIVTKYFIDADVLEVLAEMTKDIEAAVGKEKIENPKCEDNVLKDLASAKTRALFSKIKKRLTALIKVHGPDNAHVILESWQTLYKKQWGHKILESSDEPSSQSEAHAYIGYFNNYGVSETFDTDSDWEFIYEQAVENFKTAKKELLLAKKLAPRHQKHTFRRKHSLSNRLYQNYK